MKIIKICFLIVCLFASAINFSANSSAQNQVKLPTKILLIPLDDRPPCLQFPVKMGLIGDAEVVTPPIELLGKFTEAGKSDEIINWLKKQDLKSFDAAIISIDMLAYGGLVAMRVHDTDDTTALKRLEFLKEMRRLAPKMKIYGASVIMRLAPTGTGANESYRENLAKWAEISVDLALKNETVQLEKKIPAEALANYKSARARDLKINQSAVSFVGDKTIDYLILSQDDAKPKGVHVADRENLIAITKKLNLTERIAVQPGADEVSMLLLARALSDKYDFHPKIKAVYSSEAAAAKVMPFEDRALNQTVSFHIKAIGGREVTDETAAADLLFYVYASRSEAGKAESFAREIESKTNQNKQIIVADIDPKGDVQGGDASFTAELERKNLLPRINSYAAWNTAGNTIGTTLPQGAIFALSKAKLLKSNDAKARILTAQNWFTFHRVLDDYYFHTIVRAKAKAFIAENKWNALRLSDESTRKVEAYSLNLLEKNFKQLSRDYFDKTFAASNRLTCAEPSNLKFDLPWNRTFEAEINFNLQCRLDAQN